MKYLESVPERASGELTIKGTRIRIAQVITMLANGFTIEQLHEEWFPRTYPWTRCGERSRRLPTISAPTPMPKRFFKHKLLLDEHLPPRQRLAHLNERFDVKHIVHDLHEGGMADAPIHELAVAQERLVLTSNVRDFRPLLRADSPGVIGIPETWSAERLDTKLTALLTGHGPAYFRGRVRTLGAEEARRAA